MLAVGFSLGEGISFLKVMMPQKAPIFSTMLAQLSRGGTFAEAVKPFLKEDVYYQILIAEQHGDLSTSLSTLGQYLDVKQTHHVKLIQLLEYPALLGVFLVMLMLGMKLYIFPELNTWNALTQVHTLKPTTIGIYLMGICLIGGVGIKWHHLAKQSTFSRTTFFCRLPVVGKIYQNYCHYYLSLNLAMLLESGLGIRSICQMLSGFSSTSLLYQIGCALEEQLIKGQRPNLFINRYPFIPRELNVLLNKGNTTATIGKELMMFSKIKYQKLILQIEKLIGLVQPLLFLIIGLVIVFMYLSLLLPMYHSMEGVYK